jgi:hypothetical protein
MRLGSVQQLTSHAHKVHSAQLIKPNTISPIASDQEYIVIIKRLLLQKYQKVILFHEKNTGVQDYSGCLMQLRWHQEVQHYRVNNLEF